MSKLMKFLIEMYGVIPFLGGLVLYCFLAGLPVASLLVFGPILVFVAIAIMELWIEYKLSALLILAVATSPIAMNFGSEIANAQGNKELAQILSTHRFELIPIFVFGIPWACVLFVFIYLLSKRVRESIARILTK